MESDVKFWSCRVAAPAFSSDSGERVGAGRYVWTFFCSVSFRSRSRDRISPRMLSTLRALVRPSSGRFVHIARPSRPLPGRVLRAPSFRPRRATTIATATMRSSPGESSEESWTGGDVDSLARWLRAGGVDPDAFGVGASKSLDDLALEVARGETILDRVLPDGTAVRRVRVLRLLIRDGSAASDASSRASSGASSSSPLGRVLVEARQEWSDGRTRERGTPLSEKLLGGERWQDAAPRAVAEELGSCLSPGYSFRASEASVTTKTTRRESASYPGLASVYEMITADATVDGLPTSRDVVGAGGRIEGGFTSVEETPGGVITATWVWRDVGELDL